MGAQPMWKVPLRGEATPELVILLETNGIHEFSGHGGQAIAEGGKLPTPTSFLFVVGAESASDAPSVVAGVLPAGASLVIDDTRPIEPVD
jgi:hypothetical protein